jgi:hypothetical protein
MDRCVSNPNRLFHWVATGPERRRNALTMVARCEVLWVLQYLALQISNWLPRAGKIGGIARSSLARGGTANMFSGRPDGRKEMAEYSSSVRGRVGRKTKPPGLHGSLHPRALGPSRTATPAIASRCRGVRPRDGRGNLDFADCLPAREHPAPIIGLYFGESSAQKARHAVSTTIRAIRAPGARALPCARSRSHHAPKPQQSHRTHHSSYCP